MSSDDLTLDELQDQLNDNQQQLDSIVELLQDDPTNDELIQLKNDLLDVISLTKTAINDKQQLQQQQQSTTTTTQTNGTDTATSQQSIADVATVNNDNHKSSKTRSSRFADSNITTNDNNIQPPPTKRSRWGDNTITNNNNNTTSTTQQNANNNNNATTDNKNTPLTKSTSDISLSAQIAEAIKQRLVNNNSLINAKLIWNIGQRCLALYEDDNQYYNAEILTVPTDNNSSIYTVRWLDYGTDSNVDYKHIKQYNPLSAKQCHSNTLIRAIDSDDSLFHDAVVISFNNDTQIVTVKFTKLKKQCDVKLYDCVERYTFNKNSYLYTTTMNDIKNTIESLWPNCSIHEPQYPIQLQLHTNDSSDIQAIKHKKRKKYMNDWQKVYNEVALEKQHSTWNDFKQRGIGGASSNSAINKKPMNINPIQMRKPTVSAR